MIPLLLAVTVAVSAPADATFHPTRLLVKLKAGAPSQQVEALHLALGARVLRDIPQIRWQVLEVPRGRRDELRALYAGETTLIEHAADAAAAALAAIESDIVRAAVRAAGAPS